MCEILRLENIVKVFPGTIALDSMKLSVNAGEIHSICGENGAGKSTLMKIVTGVYRPDTGQIYLDGEKINFNNPREASKKGISIIYQETSLFEEMTILDNIFLGDEITKNILGIRCIDYESMEAETIKVFEMMNISLDFNQKVKSLGMAQKQIVEIAKALKSKSKILILDEPTASLTEREVVALFKIIRMLRDDGVAVIYISHRLDEIFEVSNRVTVIRDGKFISCRKTSDITKNDLVTDMVGRSVENYYPKFETEIGEEIFCAFKLNQFGVLHDVDLNIHAGEIVGLSGLAGAGRTELALAICGFVKIDSGEIILEGKKRRISSYLDAMEAGIVYVSEDRGKYGLVTEMSIKHNITMSQLKAMKSTLFIDNEREEKLARKYIDEFGIKCKDSDLLAQNLSGGNQQKVSVSKAISLSPKVLILDEPTRGIDINAKVEIYNIIMQLVKNGTSVLMISSEMAELIGMCDRIYVMQSGHIKGEVNRVDFSQEKLLKMALEVE